MGMIGNFMRNYYMMENINKDITINLINESINEELTINEKHHGYQVKLFDNIDKILKLCKYNGDENRGVFKVKYTESLFGKEVEVNLTSYNYSTNSWKHINRGVDMLINQYDEKNNVLRITVKCVNREYDKVFLSNVISHELTHIMQSVYNANNPETSKWYGIACKYYGSENELLDAISTVIYHSDKNEIEAFGNGLYAELIEYSEENKCSIDDCVKNTASWKYLDKVLKSIKIIENNNNKNKVDKILNNIFNGLTYNRLLKYCKYCRSEMLKKYGKVIVKLKEENLKHIRF